MTKVIRDRSWIEREYNTEKWPFIHRQVEGLMADGETSLARLLNLSENVRRDRLPWAKGDTERQYFVAFGSRVALPFISGFEAFNALIAEVVRKACKPETAALVELGSGIGYNLFRAWLAGAPRDIPYFAFEYTEAGRRCSELLASAEPEMDLRAVPFDYRNPDYSSLPGDAAHLVVFTCQSLEQVPQLPADVFDGLMERAKRITCLHFEPIGWQLSATRDAPKADTSSQAYAESHDYNRNAWRIIKGLKAAGKIRITAVEPNLYGFVTDNAVSLISWEKA